MSPASQAQSVRALFTCCCARVSVARAHRPRHGSRAPTEEATVLGAGQTITLTSTIKRPQRSGAALTGARRGRPGAGDDERPRGQGAGGARVCAALPARLQPAAGAAPGAPRSSAPPHEAQFSALSRQRLCISSGTRLAVPGSLPVYPRGAPRPPDSKRTLLGHPGGAKRARAQVAFFLPQLLQN